MQRQNLPGIGSGVYKIPYVVFFYLVARFSAILYVSPETLSPYLCGIYL
jgi:hypothetical protein